MLTLTAELFGCLVCWTECILNIRKLNAVFVSTKSNLHQKRIPANVYR